MSIGYDSMGLGEISMILASIAAAALVVSVATGPAFERNGSTINLSAREKNAAVQPLVRSATECIARTILGDPRLQTHERVKNLGDLIVASMPICVTPVRAMIDAYDQYFGNGTGEAFFMGPYLDALPTIVNRWIDSPTNRADAPTTAE
jgi:hypothetical protein